MIKKHPDYKLLPYERETVINLNEEDSWADVYTYKRKFKKRLAKLLKEFPDLCEMQENKNATPEEIDQLVNDSQECLWVRIPKELIKLDIPRAKRELTEEQKEALRQRMAKARAALGKGDADDPNDDIEDDDDELEDEE